jgi:MYXO-CTERM domain-containing protein
MRARGSLRSIALPALSLVAVSVFGAPAGAVPTEPNTLVNPMASAMQCQNCHTFDNAEEHQGDPLYAPFVGWQGSMMANAARDPVFWAGVAIASQDEETPGTTAECVRCHSPRAFVEGRGDAISIDQLQPGDLEGVTCELCHRAMEDPGVPTGNALYTIDDTLVGAIVPRRGPWTYPGPFAPPHEWMQDSYIGSSRMCGTCHDVTTPRERVDDAGAGMGVEFNEQRTYSEWLGSAFAVEGEEFRSCQDCHMPAVADVPGCQDAVNSSNHPEGGRRHDLVGANRFMLGLLQQEYGAGGTNEIPDIFFDFAMDRTDDLLATAATLEVQGPADVNLGEGLSGLQATVTNETGHKLPTGYSEGRVMWIEVVASYGGATVWSSGQWTDGQGFEEDGQIRTYRAIAEDYDSGATFHLLLNNHWVEDTRIPPRGLQQDPQTDPVGDRYTPLPDGTWPNSDTAMYTFDAANQVVDATPDDATDDVLDVRVRVLYLINTAEYIEFLADENRTNTAGADVAALFEAAGGATPLVLAEQTLAIPIVGFGEIPGGTTTGSGGNVDDTTGPPATTAPMTTDGDGTSSGTSVATETDTAANDDDGGGCACTTTAPRGAGASWLLALALLGLRRRRSA